MKRREWNRTMDLSAVPEPFRELAWRMHKHGELQKMHAIYDDLSLAPLMPLRYDEDDRAHILGLIDGLDFRIREILVELEESPLFLHE